MMRFAVDAEGDWRMNDLISRQALLAEYDRIHIGEPGRARKMIEDAPTVQPNTAMWLLDGTVHGEVMHRCSKCGGQERVPLVMGLPSWKFCPNCGAEMGGK